MDGDLISICSGAVRQQQYSGDGARQPGDLRLDEPLHADMLSGQHLSELSDCLSECVNVSPAVSDTKQANDASLSKTDDLSNTGKECVLRLYTDVSESGN